MDAVFAKLTAFLTKTPSVQGSIGTGIENGFWWVKFKIDINNKLAWNVIQELGCVVNYVSINERLPTVFYPVSPAPYLNGGPEDFLSWVIENKDESFTPDNLAGWLEGRLPNPVDDLSEWGTDE